MVFEGGHVAGVVFQSPLDFIAAITPMAPSAAAFAADAIARSGSVLPGASGEAGTAARFAGQWAESTGCAAVPTFGQRLYRFGPPGPLPDVPGSLRPAQARDRDALVAWMACFREEVGPTGPARDPGALVDRRMAAGQLWVWDVDRRPTSLAVLSSTAAGVARIGPVFTPPDLRRRGYAGACVAGVSRLVVEQGGSPILYTDLANPTSNSLYRRLGYEAVIECIAYDFRPRPRL
ncbi:MAG: GNAT family N-acetyltransferase [Acidimicrobiales bacterium]